MKTVSQLRSLAAMLTLSLATLGTHSLIAQQAPAPVSRTHSSASAVTPPIAAANHNAQASTKGTISAVTVDGTATNQAPTRAFMTPVGILGAETGCPNRPISSTTTGESFVLSGKGFTPGAVVIHLDTLTGMNLGQTIAAADGTFCQKLAGVPSSVVGTRMLVAVQSHAVASRAVVTFVKPTVLH